MHSKLLQMKDIKKSFGAVNALKGVQLELSEGEVLALMGENGAGKSTLMNVLCGAISTYEGEIFIHGKRVEIGNPIVSRNLGIAKIHQELQLVNEMTIAENMFLGREPKTKAGFVDNKKMQDDAKKYLEMLELNVSANRKISSLRVGEQQLVEIAKAISLNARILIMDEPTSAISKAETELLFKVIRKLAEEKVGIIYITHRMDEVFALANRLTVLRDGQYVGTVEAKNSTREQIISMMVGREVSEIFPKESLRIGEEVLRVENLSFSPRPGSYKRPIKNISFSLHKGEVIGIAGLMGAGRSELFESLFGMHPHAVKGDVYLEGKKLVINKPKDAIQAGISFATEDRKGMGLVLQRSIGENMSLPLLDKFCKFFFMKEADERREWSKQIDSMRIKAPSYHTLARNLSGGNQQKVILGRWLMTHPKVLLLDEPTRGIDVGAKAEIYMLINELAKQGMGILVISSELPEIIGVSDRIITFCEGRMTGIFNRDEATQERLLYAATTHEEVI